MISKALLFACFGLSTGIAGAAPLQLVVPAYFYPEAGSPWSALTDSRPTASIVIFNPDSGPGAALDPNFVQVAQGCKKAGIRLAGYIDTRYAAAPMTEMEAEIDRYRNWYGVNDLFVDDCSAKLSDVAYYKKLNAYMKARTSGAVTILNPGTVPDEAYLEAGDVVAVFEDDLAAYRKTTFPSWMSHYPPARFLHIVYDVPQASLTATMQRAARNGAGYFYATDEGMKDPDPAKPYGRLPSYYGAEIEAAAHF